MDVKLKEIQQRIFDKETKTNKVSIIRYLSNITQPGIISWNTDDHNIEDLIMLFKYYANVFKNTIFLNKTLVFSNNRIDSIDEFVNILKLFHNSTIHIEGIYPHCYTSTLYSTMHWFINVNDINVSKFMFDFNESDCEYDICNKVPYIKSKGNKNQNIHKFPREMIHEILKMLKTDNIEFKSNMVCVDMLFNINTRKIPWNGICKIYEYIGDHIKTSVVSDIIISYLQ